MSRSFISDTVFTNLAFPVYLNLHDSDRCQKSDTLLFFFLQNIGFDILFQLVLVAYL